MRGSRAHPACPGKPRLPPGRRSRPPDGLLLHRPDVQHRALQEIHGRLVRLVRQKRGVQGTVEPAELFPGAAGFGQEGEKAPRLASVAKGV